MVSDEHSGGGVKSVVSGNQLVDVVLDAIVAPTAAGPSRQALPG